MTIVQLAQFDSVRAIFTFRCLERQGLYQAPSKSNVNEVRLIEQNQQAQMIAELASPACARMTPALMRMTSKPMCFSAHPLHRSFRSTSRHVAGLRSCRNLPAGPGRRTPQLHVEIFERNRELMSPMQGPERRQVGRTLPRKFMRRK